MKTDTTDCQLTGWKDDLHRHPELGLDLPWTSAYIQQALEKTGAQILEPMPHAVAAWFDFGRESTLMFRADMDALPVREQTGAPCTSLVPGRMHACGHDAHMSILLGFAQSLAERTE